MGSNICSIYVAHDGDQWRDIVNMAVNLSFLDQLRMDLLCSFRDEMFEAHL
jgi:hypothetical protein